MSSLYESDLYTWALQQAEALRAAARLKLNTPLAIDWENLAEEVEDMARAQARELRSRYFRLLTHLLKWEFQPECRSSSWRGTIGEQRRELIELLHDNPGLKPKQDELYARAYANARGQAADETGLPLATFPETCPYTLDEAMDLEFWPGPSRDRG